MEKELILQKLMTTKIKMAQIDPFSFCNAKCWFCPVKYKSNPKETIKHMSPDVFEKIISEMCQERDQKGIVAPDFHFIYTAHYNEILLYKYFENMCEILRKYKIKTYVLTNGIPLTREKTDLIKKYTDVVVGICLNVPAFEEDIWSKRSGMSASLFSRLIDNIKYAENQLVELTNNKRLSLQINSATNNSFVDKGGWLTKGENFPQDLDLNINTGELASQHKLCKEMFPNINVYPMPSLIDRAGILDKFNVISNKNAIEKKLKKSGDRVIGCGNGREVGGRPFGWIHVNANADLFLCCNDYDFEHCFGNLEKNKLNEVWITDKHVDVIHKSFNTICTNCASSLWNVKKEN